MQRSPKIAFIKEDQELPQANQAPKTTIGSTGNWPSAVVSLSIGEAVELELAKTLRNGNLISVTGELARTVISERSTYATIVIRTPRVAALTEEEAAQYAQALATAASANVKEIPSAYLRYATGLIRQYDQNDDQHLDKSEWAQMPKSPAAADINNDGKVSPKELARFKFEGN